MIGFDIAGLVYADTALKQKSVPAYGYRSSPGMFVARRSRILLGDRSTARRTTTLPTTAQRVETSIESGLMGSCEPVDHGIVAPVSGLAPEPALWLTARFDWSP